MPGSDTATITLTVTLHDLLAMTVTRPGYEDEGLEVVTIAQLVVDRVAETAMPYTSEIRAMLEREARQAVRRLVAVALESPPVAGDSLSSLIIAEAKAQLGPEQNYHGTATPMAQWLAGAVYRQLRDPEVDLIGKAVRQVDDIAKAAIKAEIARRFGPS